jgi:hypothetical protein
MVIRPHRARLDHIGMARISFNKLKSGALGTEYLYYTGKQNINEAFNIFTTIGKVYQV